MTPDHRAAQPLPSGTLDRDIIDAAAKRYNEEVVPLLTARTTRACGCVVLTYSCRVLSMCGTHAGRLYG